MVRAKGMPTDGGRTAGIAAIGLFCFPPAPAAGVTTRWHGSWARSLRAAFLRPPSSFEAGGAHRPDHAEDLDQVFCCNPARAIDTAIKIAMAYHRANASPAHPRGSSDAPTTA